MLSAPLIEAQAEKKRTTGVEPAAIGLAGATEASGRDRMEKRPWAMIPHWDLDPRLAG